MTQTQEIQVAAEFLPDKAMTEAKLKAIRAFQEVCRQQMIAGLDYGLIPGTHSPALLKPGAEKIAKLLGLADQYEILDKVEDWDKGFFHYAVKCTLQDIMSQRVVSSGLGSCNTKEAHYRWRERKRKCPRCGAETIFKSKQAKGGWYCYSKLGGCSANFVSGDQSIESQPAGRVENDDPFSLVNTVLKMARKRALVDAALSAGRLSDIFTQDLEDLKGELDEENEEPAPATLHSGQAAPVQSAVQPLRGESDYSTFFKAAKVKGLSPDQALAKLGAKHWNEWLKLGGDLKTALARLERARVDEAGKVVDDSPKQ